MAQHDYVIANGTGAAVRSDLNNALAAIVSQNSGATAPSTTYAYMPWADTTTGLFKIRNAANNGWITLYQLDGEWSTIALENGSAAAPSIYFKDSGTDTGIYSPGTDQVAISTGGTGRLFVDSSGRVGLGSSAPDCILDVRQATASGRTNVTFINTASPTLSNRVRIRLAPSSGFAGIDSHPYIESYCADAANQFAGLAFGTYGNGGVLSEKMRITDGGAVGIGTASPGQTLHVVGISQFTNTNTVFINPNYNSEGVAFQNFSNVPTIFTTNNTERCRLTADGKWLVGTSTAANNLGTGAIQVGSGHTGIVNTGSVTAPTILSSGSLEFSFDGVSGTQRHGRISGNGSTTGGAYAGGLTFEYYAFDGSTYRWFPGITLDSGGNVAFAGDNITTSNGNIGRVYKFFGAANNIIFVGETTGSDRSTILEHRRNGRSGSARCSQINIGENASAQGSIDIYASAANADLSGGVRLANGATSWSSISDIRLKDITSLFDNALSDVSALQAFRFTWKDDASATPQVGLSAQSVQAVLPEAVSSGKPINASEDDDAEYLSVRYTEVIPLLVAALQESKQRIETLEAKVAALEAS